MKFRGCTRSVVVALPLLVVFLAGCGDFWQNPNGTSATSFSMSNSGSITVAPGATSGNTATITVTPGSSFTGTVTLACSITTEPSNPTSPTTCSLSPTSVSLSSSTAETSTLTASTTSSTTTGAYEVEVTGTSGTIAESTTVCVEVSSSSGSCTSGSGTSGIFFVLNQTTSQIVVAKLVSGSLTTIGSVSTPASHPFAIAIAPNGNFLYVSTLNGIYVYTISSGGTLTLGNGGAAISADPASTMQVDATNSWLVESISGSSALYAIAVNSSTGDLATSGETEQTLAGGLPSTTPVELAISPNDSSSCTDCYVFVAMGSGGIELVAFNPANSNPFGSTAHVGLINSSGGANTIAVDPTNRLLYVGESDALSSATQSGGLCVYTISASGATAISGSPYPTAGTGPSSILPSADGNYVYVANQSVSGSSSDNITSFSVSTTALSQIGTVAAGPTGQIGLAEDSTSSFLLAVDIAGAPDLQAYTMSSGALTSTFTGATGTDPVGASAVVAAP
jgi:6-phosphogluconolactonase (cycloisomerase 2 family)